MCASQFGIIERQEKEILDMLPKSWHVNVAFYKGRLALYQNDYIFARHKLNEAYELCHAENSTNRGRILTFLIPVQMASGRCPTEKLLRQYNLLEYIELANACLKGDMAAVEQAIQKNMDIYIQWGVFAVIERIKMVTLRNFIQRVFIAISKSAELQVQEGKPN